MFICHCATAHRVNSESKSGFCFTFIDKELKAFNISIKKSALAIDIMYLIPGTQRFESAESPRAALVALKTPLLQPALG